MFLLMRDGHGFKCSFLFPTQPLLTIRHVKHTQTLRHITNNINTTLSQHLNNSITIGLFQESIPSKRLTATEPESPSKKKLKDVLRLPFRRKRISLSTKRDIRFRRKNITFPPKEHCEKALNQIGFCIYRQRLCHYLEV